jgi:hypothetical protein
MKRHFPIIILLGCAAAFVFGVAELFKLRFESGDVYPPYSSLRADPLGTMAVYESLGKMPGLTVRRDYSASNLLPEERQTVYLHLAAEPYDWDFLPDDVFRELKRFLARDGRLVITYFPQTWEPHRFFLDEDKTNSPGTNSLGSEPPKSGKKEPAKSKPATKKKKPREEKAVNLGDKWGFHERYVALVADGDNYAPITVENRSHLKLPQSLDWHSGMVFTNCDPAWRVIYARGTNAVVIERTFGKGSVVIASDSYFLSNEAMLKDRHADLLAWLVGANNQVVFDEAHLGVMERSGIAVLMRKYRLHGLAAGLLLLAGLFIWKNSVSLVPSHAEARREDFVAGKTAASGFINLLRRNIAPRDAFATCFAEWKKTAGATGKISRARLQAAEAIFASEKSLATKDRNAIAAYRKISETLGNRKIRL